MRKVVLLIAGVALVATACRAEVNLIVDVEEDRSGIVVIEFGADDEFIQLIESTGGAFRASFSLSGTLLRQLEAWAPEVLDSYRALFDTGCSWQLVPDEPSR